MDEDSDSANGSETEGDGKEADEDGDDCDASSILSDGLINMYNAQRKSSRRKE